MKTPVFHSFPKWQLSGVNSWSVNLAAGMKEDPDFQHVMLITGVPSMPVPELDALGIPYRFLDVSPQRRRKDEWASLKTLLEDSAPCIYIPNYDFHRSCAIGSLSSAVKVCAVIHSDEECYYDEVRRLGKYFDAVVTVSSLLERNLRHQHPDIRSRLQWIPHGVPYCEGPRESVGAEPCLRLFYCNRISQYQKRVFDLPEVCSELVRLGVDFHLTVAGAGPDEEELRLRFARKNLNGKVHMAGRLSGEEVRRGFLNSDIFLLTSDFEGLPISLLESMAAGCVPIVYDIDSGVRDAIDDGVNGKMLPRGDFSAMARAIAALADDRGRLRELSASCVARHAESFSVRSMASAYKSLFQRLMDDRAATSIRDGRIRVPRDLKLSHRIVRKLGISLRLTGASS